MRSLTSNPMLGHITTFGGHPVSCAAGLAALNLILSQKLHHSSEENGRLFKELLKHEAIAEIRGSGLFIAVELQKGFNRELFFKRCLEKGVIYDYFLFTQTAFRIAPPLTITKAEIKKATNLILEAMDEVFY
jgi:acetylornithine/N-succinyldiaminopimelate aminotransferase